MKRVVLALFVFGVPLLALLGAAGGVVSWGMLLGLLEPSHVQSSPVLSYAVFLAPFVGIAFLFAISWNERKHAIERFSEELRRELVERGWSPPSSRGLP